MTVTELNQCDFGHPTHQEVRLLPTSAGDNHGNVIVCKKHFEHEIKYRRAHGFELAPSWNPYPAWSELKVYYSE